MSVDAKLSAVKSELVGQARSHFDSFAKSLEERFSKMDDHFSQVIPASSSEVASDRNISRNYVGQDVLIALFQPLPQ